MPDHVSVAVVEADTPTRERLTALLGDGVAAFSTIGELAARLTGTVPVVLVLGPSCANGEALGVADDVMHRYPMLATILVADGLSTPLLQQALRCGVRDVVDLSVEADSLPQSVVRLARSLGQAHDPGTAPSGAHGGTIVGVDGPRPDEPEQVDGQVLTVFSPKGGSGKSVLAASLAVTLAQRSTKPVCLVDADLQFGDIAVMLKLTPHHTIVDAVSALGRMDAPLLESLLVTHEPSGLRVLPAPLEPALADKVGAAEMVAIIEMLRSFCSYVVVDTPAYFNDVVLGVVEISDKVMLVAGMDIPNIKNLKIGLQTLRLLKTPMDKLLLVLNRANSKVKLDIGEVERTLQLTADALIPSDVVVPRSVNKGEPVVLHAPRSGVARSIQKLADQFLPSEAPKRRR